MQTTSKTFVQLIVNLKKKMGGSRNTCVFLYKVTETFNRLPSGFTAA